MKITLLLAALIVCAGCENTVRPKYGYDQCMQRDIFKECVAAIHTSDHGKSVKACDEAAFSQSFRPYNLIKEECK